MSLTKRETDEAIAQFRQGLTISPNDAGAHNNLGAALFMKGNLDEAMSNFRKALEINPNYEDARNNERLAAGKLHEPGQFESSAQSGTNSNRLPNPRKRE